MAKLTGTAPSQVPTNADLGDLAYQDGDNAIIGPITVVDGDVAVDTDTLFVDTANNRVGIGTSSPASTLHISSTAPEITLTDTSTGVDHELSGNSGVGNLFLHVDKNNEGSDPKFLVSVGSNDDVLVVRESGVVEITEGSVVLNGSTISAIQVTIADDAVAELTFTNRNFGMLSVVEGANDDVLPSAQDIFLGYADFGDSPIHQAAIIGSETVVDNTNTLTGTTGTDGKFTIGTAGTSGTLYLENRRGITRTFNVTLL
jgi:hypothetical protein